MKITAIFFCLLTLLSTNFYSEKFDSHDPVKAESGTIKVDRGKLYYEVAGAVKYFHKKRHTEPGIKLFEEREMNALGYRFLQKGKVKVAIELFKLNVIAYPKSANVYDSLGEAYLKDGQKDLAIKNYEKSLKLNPGNINAKNVLKELRREK